MLIPPTKFIRRPAIWLRALSDYRGTQSPAPNFAYGLLLTKVKERALPSFDLSSWRSAICGAEPIDPEMLRAFCEKFRAAKLNPLAPSPAYGLAEASLCVTLSSPSEPLQAERVAAKALYDAQRAEPAASSEAGVWVCSCGRPVEGTQIEIRNEAHLPLPDGGVGQIWISGRSVMKGYFEDADHDEEALIDGWLNTGDVGYMRSGSLFVLGRDKELIIIRGQNYYPTDFERAAAEVEGITSGKVAAIGIYNQAIYSEELHLLCEVRMSQRESDLAEQVQAHVARETGIRPASVHLVSRGTIPRTTSGKLQRGMIKRRFQEEMMG